VPVSAHFSVLLILLLLTQILALSVLPAALPGQTTMAYWLAAALASVVFLAALLAHELAHAIVARHNGIPVKRITLWMFGGQTELGGQPPSPRADALIAAAGPATSLGLGGMFAGSAWLFNGSGLWTATLAWLAGVNVLLAVFNLLPGAPLDGGRLLRALLWRHYGDRIRAAELSARAGQAVGTFLLILGLLQLLVGSVFGLWLALIGWFVLGAAAGERYAALSDRLRGLTARDVMTIPPATAPSWWAVSDFLTHLGSRSADQRVYPLIDFDGQPQNVLHVRDLLRVRPDQRATVRLRDAARSRVRVLTVTPDVALADIAVAIHRHGGVAVVTDENHVVGTLTESDLARPSRAASTGRRAPGERYPAELAG
jgi:Zn-dependent protease/CBS domain-containing protein